MKGKIAPRVKGKLIDEFTRCTHYHSSRDIIAIKFKCCGEYYPCYECHAEEAGHQTVLWGKHEFETNAVLCGACKNEMAIREYLDSGNQCPFCKALFNPNCRNHYHLYFEV